MCGCIGKINKQFSTDGERKEEEGERARRMEQEQERQRRGAS